jgi:hypothetical protein
MSLHRSRHAPPHAARPRPRQVGDTVCELAAGILEEGGWPELLPFLFQAVQGGPDALRESALLIFAQLTAFIGAQMAPYISTLHQGESAGRFASRSRSAAHVGAFA